MDHSGFVRSGQGVGGLCRIADRLLDRQPAAGEHRGQRFAADVLHDDEVDASGRVDFMDGDDVRMNERGCGASLAEEPFLLEGRDLVARQNLDGDLAIEAGVAGAPHFAHTSGSEVRHDLIVQELEANHAGAGRI